MQAECLSERSWLASQNRVTALGMVEETRRFGPDAQGNRGKSSGRFYRGNATPKTGVLTATKLSIVSFPRVLLTHQPISAHRPERLARLAQDGKHILHRPDEARLQRAGQR